ncbi:phage holin family protein [Falsirhodobacter xinxiangensis]|uniref:phage holin family protein n=1 Tax=Falsirhodobacter xinxiangensis TaxID=2530049 RepID=UPI0010AA9208|nr:phage holin family protein [Rhodobacter xinxiangensis]
MAIHDQHETRSLPALLGDLIRDLSDLIRSESRLVRAEINESSRRLATGAEMLAAGAIIMLLAAIVLLQALVIALAFWLGPLWAAVAVGGVLFVIGGLLMVKGRTNLSLQTLVPERTVDQTARDAKLAKETLR